MSEGLSVLLRRLLDYGEAPADQFDFEEADPQRLGLLVRNGKVLLPAGAAALDAEAISALLAPEAAQWLRGVTVFPAMDSTNSRMVKLAQSASIDGLAWFAELQTAGRGRRGRRWITPFGLNIALSLGFELGLPAGALGGLSLVIGLAVAEFLRHEGVAAAAVKWPNDVYIGGAKVCGILMEVLAKAERCACIVGIGLNVDLPAVDNAVTAPREALYGTDRVFVLDGERMRRVEVERLGETRTGDGGARLILRSPDLKPDGRLIVTHQPNAIDGLKVRVAEAPPG